MICDTCEANTQPYAELVLDPATMQMNPLQKCGACHVRWRERGAARSTLEPTVVRFETEEPEPAALRLDRDPEMAEPPRMKQLAGATMGYAENARPLVQEDEELDVVAIARRRLSALTAEIAVLEKLKLEASRLERMILAAEAFDAAESALHPHPEHA